MAARNEEVETPPEEDEGYFSPPTLSSRTSSFSRPSRRLSVTFADQLGQELCEIITEPLLVEAPVPQHEGRAEEWMCEYSQPAAAYSFFLSRLENQRVALENAYVDGDFLVGLLRVVPNTQSKEVFIRLTCDYWTSFIDHLADALSTSVGESFSFRIKLPESGRVEFAVCARDESGPEFWDNNAGSNFALFSCPTDN